MTVVSKDLSLKSSFCSHPGENVQERGERGKAWSMSMIFFFFFTMVAWSWKTYVPPFAPIWLSLKA